MTSTTSGPIVLPDRFRVDREIARGGMAVVYSAHDHHLSREMAIKVLAEELSSVVGAERFQREIDVMAKLVHPGNVALFDSGETDGRLYYVMPLLSGETLRGRLVRERGAPAVTTVVPSRIPSLAASGVPEYPAVFATIRLGRYTHS